MAMSKKDFVAIAETIRACYPLPENTPAETWEVMMHALKHTLSRSNDRFDNERFERACRGIEGK